MPSDFMTSVVPAAFLPLRVRRCLLGAALVACCAALPASASARSAPPQPVFFERDAGGEDLVAASGPFAMRVSAAGGLRVLDLDDDQEVTEAALDLGLPSVFQGGVVCWER